MTIRRQLMNFGPRSTDYRVGSGAFDELPRLFSGVVARPQRSLLVFDGSEPADRVESVERALIDSGFRVSRHVVDSATDLSLFSSVDPVLAALDGADITSEDLLVALGDSSLIGLCSFAARMWCDGVACAAIPTSLDAMVSVCTEMPSLSSTSGMPEISLKPHLALCVCDLDFVLDAPIEQNGLGYVKIVAAYLSESRRCWEGCESAVAAIRQGSASAFTDALCAVQSSRLDIVKSVSPSTRQSLMYGKVTARALRSCLGDDIPEYRLLAEGMRFEARVAHEVLDFSIEDVFAQDDRFDELGIDELGFELDPKALVEAIKAERFRHVNRFLLSLPKYPGTIRLTSVDDEVLMRHATAYLASRAELLAE